MDVPSEFPEKPPGCLPVVRNGVHLAKHFMRNPLEVKRPSFETEMLLSNIAAIAKNTRYVEEDLNRCFKLKDLVDESKATLSLERRRAREVDVFLGPKRSAEPRCDLIIDLHTSTASTGFALMVAPNDDFAHEIGRHLMTLDKGVRVVQWNPDEDWPFCPTVGRSGMTFEMGPCSWGCVEPALFMRARRLLHALLDYVEAHNEMVAKGRVTMQQVKMPVYRRINVAIDYPRNHDGELVGMVHPSLQGQDFRLTAVTP